ncbi:hypothetical protein GQ55_2G226000 [Panicum hallii var. hallii]|uniref:BTB domain-containing protein n=1 Tax=Panicum hallii var. hallii TaxID=1504633 RepID=A0A2T7ERC6_9POAL|nr:hypothetical protein GQ55_2G226000 [Panicum hallii var. hallii]
MAEQKASNVVFHAREAKSFNLRVNNSASMHLPGVQCVETDVPAPAAAGFRITTKYWPHWDSRALTIKISVVITRTHNQRFKVVTGHINLPSRTGLPVPHVVHRRELVPATGECEGGISLLTKRADVEANCVVNGHFTAVCTEADYDISMIPDLADVSFQVEGETFRAHRLVLAARSPVFKAELYGQMAESKASSITIHDKRAPTFKFMLEYMYHGLLPAAAADMDDAALKMEFQHLYVAADRYGLDTLREMCEEVLCATISVSTLLSNLVFAEERTCGKCHKLQVP